MTTPEVLPADKREFTIPHHFHCRPYQKEFYRAMLQKKRAVLVWHRRAGKEKTCWNYMIKEAFKKKGVYFYIFPTYSQGKKVLWDFIDKDGFRVLEHIPKELLYSNPNSTEMKIKLANGSLIQIVGSEHVDSLMGTNPMGCVFSEYSLQNPNAWTLLRPILAENGGWAVFNGTPRGNNWFKELYDMAAKNPEWYSQLLTVEETKTEDGQPIISQGIVESERRSGMSEDFIQQEFYCSWTMGIEGSYYSRLIEEARETERIGNVPHDDSKKVHTAWDLGYGDSTCIVFYQLGPSQEIHVIDYYENHGESMAHYISELKKRDYIYGDHFAPHDVVSKSLSSGFSAKQVAADLGVNLIVLGRDRIEDGIEAVRGIFPRLWFDEKKCDRLIKCLMNYRKEYDDIHGIYKTRPVHDWASHGADAFRYAAMAIRTYSDQTRGISDAEAERMMDKYNPRFN